MINVSTSKKDGKTIGAWVFDENQMGIFLTMPAVRKTLNIIDGLQGLCTGYEELFDGIVFYYSDTYQIVLADGSEFVIVEPDEREQFTTDLKAVPGE